MSLNTKPLPPLTKQVCQLDANGNYLYTTDADLDPMSADVSYILPGGCIDAEGEAADNAQALGGQVPGEALGSLDTLRRGIAAADHGDSASVQQVGITANVQYAGWVGDFEQGRRIAAIRQGDDALAGLAGPRQAVLDGFRWCVVEQQIGLVTDDAAHLKAPGGKDRLG